MQFHRETRRGDVSELVLRGRVVEGVERPPRRRSLVGSNDISGEPTNLDLMNRKSPIRYPLFFAVQTGTTPKGSKRQRK